MNPDLVLICIAIICLITFVVSRRIFQEQLKIGPPTLLAAAVAGLAFIGLMHHGDSLVSVVLIPYATLAIALLLLLLLLGLLSLLKKRPQHRWPSDQSLSPKPKPKEINPKPFTPKPKEQTFPPTSPGASADGTTRQPPRWQGRRHPFDSDNQ